VGDKRITPLVYLTGCALQGLLAAGGATRYVKTEPQDPMGAIARDAAALGLATCVAIEEQAQQIEDDEARKALIMEDDDE